MVEKELQLTVSPSPHLRSPVTVNVAMRDVLIALIPVTLVSIVLFKWNAVFLILVCLGTAAVTELLFRKVLKKKATLNDGSAMVTGLLVALCFGAGTAWWTAVLATFIGIGLAKELMGGLGWNRFNPALFGRLAVIMLVPIFNYVTVTFAPLRPYFGGLDVVTQATPLAMLKQGTLDVSIGQLLTWHHGGALGETSALALLIGAAYLIYKNISAGTFRSRLWARFCLRHHCRRQHYDGPGPCPGRRRFTGRTVYGYRLGHQPDHPERQAHLRDRDRCAADVLPGAPGPDRGHGLLHLDYERLCALD